MPPTRLSELRDTCANSFIQAGAVVSPLPEGFAEVVKNPGPKEIRFEARFWTVPRRGDFRTVHIFGGKVQILNQFFFPLNGLELPVFAMEYVIFGEKVAVAVLDLANPSGSSACARQNRAILRHLRGRHPTLPHADDYPDWYRECRSGDDLFVRSDDLACLPELVEACSGLAENVATRLVSEPALWPVSNAVADYKHHHRVNSPGLPFLNRTFGPDWTETFLRDHLFG